MYVLVYMHIEIIISISKYSLYFLYGIGVN